MRHSIYSTLEERYLAMASGTPSEERIAAMLRAVVENCLAWPDDKTGRWVGYVQCLLIEVEKVTTIKEERDFTRPLFHGLYSSQGFEIPVSIEV